MDRVKTDQVKTDQVKIDHVKTDQVKTDQVKIDQAKTYKVKIDHVKTDQAKTFSYSLFILFFVANMLFWMESRSIQSLWRNVPPAPEAHRAGMMTLGDDQLAYRVYATMLQNLGSSGGRYVSLKEYDFKRLKNWFLLEDKLDPVSDAVPMMAAYYYGGVKDSDKLDHVLDYLSFVGERPIAEKWRWLGHAVYLARYQQKDNDKALALAYKLAANKNPDLGDWAKQMPVFLLQAKGETELAYEIMLGILQSNVDKMHPNEINFMRDYICNTLLKDRPDIADPALCN